MKRIMNIIIDFSKTHKKIVVFVSVLISLGVICGIVIYTTGVQDKKEKELLSRIDNLEEQIKKEEDLSEKDESDTNSAESPNKETETDSTDINSKEEVGTQNNNTTTNKTGSTDILPPSTSPSIDGGKDKTGGESNEGDTSGVGEGSDELVVWSSGIQCINLDRFGECLTVVSLTIDNWRDYIDIITKNSIREFGIKTNKYHYVEKVHFKLKHNETQETKDCSISTSPWGPMGEYNGLSEDFNLDNYECTEIKGKIYFVNLPNEVIHTPLPEWNYSCGFMLVGSGIEEPYEISPQTKQIYPNGTGDWDKRYMK